MKKVHQPNRSAGTRPKAANIREERRGIHGWHRSLKRHFLVSARVGFSSLTIAIGVAVVAFVAATPNPGLQTSDSVPRIAFETRWPSIFEQPDRVNPGAAGAGAFALLTPQPTIAIAVGPATAAGRALPPAAPILPSADQFVVGQTISNVNITFYDCFSQGFCGYMYGGRIVYEGAAACSWNLAIGTHFIIVGDPTGRVYVCEDRGLLPNTWVDIFWHDPADGWLWQASVGRSGTIEILIAP